MYKKIGSLKLFNGKELLHTFPACCQKNQFNNCYFEHFSGTSYKILKDFKNWRLNFLSLVANLIQHRHVCM